MNDESPLRIALAIGTLRLGGAETQLVGLARELHRMGHHVEVFLLSSRGPLEEKLDELGIPVICAEMRGFARFRKTGVWPAIRQNAVELWRLLCLLLTIRRHRFDVVHAYLFHAYAILIPWAWTVRVPVRVAARRGLHINLPDSVVVRLFTPLSIATANAIVANSAAVAVDAQTTENVPLAKLHVIRNGLATAPELADPRLDPPTGLLVANLIHYKGHLDLIEALGLLEPATRERVRIRCIGEGPMRDAISAALSTGPLSRLMVLEGARPALPHYKDAQYALLVSHQEGLPNVIMEAMAAGLPVVATDVGGCRELVEDEVTGLLVPPRNPKALANALTRIIDDSDFRSEAGQRARERAADFSWESTARSHINLYRALLRAQR